MNFQSTKPISNWQLILALPRWCKCSSSNTNTQSLSIIPSTPFCTTQSQTVSHTPGGLKAVNVCTNRLLIEKLFMLSSGSIRIRRETGGVAPHRKKEASNTDAAVKVCCGISLRLRAVSLGGLSLHHLHATCCGNHQASPKCAQSVGLSLSPLPHF